MLLPLFLLVSLALSEDFVLQPKSGTVTSPEKIDYSMTQNDLLTLQLTELGSAGYTWVIHKYSPQLLINRKVESPNQNRDEGFGPLVGAPNRIQFTISCDHNCVGSASVSFLYIRSWLYHKFQEGGLDAYLKADDVEPGEIDVAITFI